jgi:hypothetical protein
MIKSNTQTRVGVCITVSDCWILSFVYELVIKTYHRTSTRRFRFHDTACVVIYTVQLSFVEVT